MSETLEQIDKRISEELFGTDYNGMTLKYARHLVAALGAQEPVAWHYATSGSNSFLSYSGPEEGFLTGGQPLYAAPIVNEGWQMRYAAAHSELVRMTDQLGECRNVANDLRQQRDDLLAALTETVGALGKLSFHCDGVTRTEAPPREIYNETYEIYRKHQATTPEYGK